MRYYTNKPDMYYPICGEVYECNHVIYDKCTLFKEHNIGLCIIQQRYNEDTKSTFWGPIDDWLNNQLYFCKGFKTYFKKYAKEPTDGIYPTVTIRQIMWALRMKPLKRESWETVFDRCPL